MKIERKGKGGIKQRLDVRDRKWSKIGAVSVPFNWTVGYNPVDEAITKDQGTSFSCGGMAGAYLTTRILNVKETSAKSIYSFIFYPGGGSVLRDILGKICNRGVNLEKDVPSIPNTEYNLTRTNWVTPALDTQALSQKGLRYAFVNNDIDSVAQAIRDTGGAIILLTGQNNGTWTSPIPAPPSNNRNTWNHFVFCGAAFLKDDKKVIKIHNSWGDIGEKGWQYIDEDYFKSGRVLEAGVVYRQEEFSPVEPSTKKEILQQLIKLYYALLDNMRKGI